jgi:hypothetical protein
MIRRLRSAPAAFLKLCEGFVEQESTGRDGVDERGTQVALQVSRDDDQLERIGWERGLRQIPAPGANYETAITTAPDRVGNHLEPVVDAERLETCCCKRERVASSSHRDVQRPARRWKLAGKPADPLSDEGRWWIGAIVVGHTLGGFAL